MPHPKGPALSMTEVLLEDNRPLRFRSRSPPALAGTAQARTFLPDRHVAPRPFLPHNIEHGGADRMPRGPGIWPGDSLGRIQRAATFGVAFASADLTPASPLPRTPPDPPPRGPR